MTQTTAEIVKNRLTVLCKNSPQHMDMQRLMTRYAIERFLWRIGQSKYADQFILKGAMAFTYYAANSSRTTKDANFTIMGRLDSVRVGAMLTEIARIKADDGITFKRGVIPVSRVGPDGANQSYSVKIPARLGTSACQFDLDISFGEALNPEPKRVSIPALLVEKALYPSLRIYAIETIIAEKYQTIVRLGMSNTRLKDHHDLYEISQSSSVYGGSLQRAIQATFERRGTRIEAEVPIGLSAGYYLDKSKQQDWKATLKQHNMPRGTDLKDACESIIGMIMPIVAAIVNNDEFAMVWDRREWRSASSS